MIHEQKVKAGCGNDIENCDMYRKCAGVGDRLNPQRGAPDINMKDAFLEFGRVSLL